VKTRPASVGRTRDRRLRATGFACGGIGLVAILAHVAGVLAMRFFLEFIAVPALVALFGVAFWATRVRADVFLHNLRLGIVAGALATVAYDAIRLSVHALGIFDYNAFYAIHVFGGWITGRPQSSLPATIAGWTYHTWNGLSFGVMFTLTFGRARRWWYGLLYGIVMESIMLGVYPQFLSIKDRAGFVTISFIGHAAYGSVLGLMAARGGRPWSEIRS
jgi:hypothetical protein